MPTRFDLSLSPTGHPLESIVHISSALLTPSFPHPLLASLPISPDHRPLPTLQKGDGWNTTFHLVFEPLIWGFVPATAVPLIYWIAGVTIIAPFLCPYLFKVVEGFAASLGESDNSKDE